MIVLSENGAKKLFGTADCLGQTVSLSVGGHRMKVTIIGVTEETNTGASDMAAMMGNGRGQHARDPLSARDHLSGADGGKPPLWTAYILSPPRREEMDDAADSAVALLEARHGNQGRNAYKAQNFLNALSAFETMMNLLTTFVAAGISPAGRRNRRYEYHAGVGDGTDPGNRHPEGAGGRTGTILFQFLTESAIITLIGEPSDWRWESRGRT